MMRKFLVAITFFIVSTQLQANAHQFYFDMMDGSTLKFSELSGKVVLVVNTASQCGFAPQYRDLQMLYDMYKDKGLVVIAVPSDDFGQEFSLETEVQEFAKEEFLVAFPLTQITQIKGENAHPFYRWAGDQAGFFGSPKWNFHKYLLDKKGNFVTWFSTTTRPSSQKIIDAIETELAK